MDLFTKFRDKADEMKNEDDFINFFKGLVIAPDASRPAPFLDSRRTQKSRSLPRGQSFQYG
jgi:hypothetical protein